MKASAVKHISRLDDYLYRHLFAGKNSWLAFTLAGITEQVLLGIANQLHKGDTKLGEAESVSLPSYVEKDTELYLQCQIVQKNYS
ncbi:MAG: hypothetical protein AAGI38_02505 [Bacteroidota bacterium]